jgi:hypothetical protein
MTWFHRVTVFAKMSLLDYSIYQLSTHFLLSETPLQCNAVAVKRRWGYSGPGRFAPHCSAALTARTYLK